jgi:N6-adenosine-specific RNA methylase IME4
MTLDAIRNEPVKDLIADNAHLHLWTTNAFLSEAFDVIRAWGFRYKSCLVWIKPQLGMGNYWRVSRTNTCCWASEAVCRFATAPAAVG